MADSLVQTAIYSRLTTYAPLAALISATYDTDDFDSYADTAALLAGGWTDASEGSGAVSLVAGEVRLAGAGAGNLAKIRREIATVSGEAVTIDWTVVSAAMSLYVGSTEGAFDLLQQSRTPGTYAETITPVGSTTYLEFRDTGTATFDDYTASSSVRVYDFVPQRDADVDADFPYVVIGDVDSEAFDADDRLGRDTFVALHVWDRADRGKKGTQAIVSAIYDALHRYALSVSGRNTVDCLWDGLSEVMLDPDGLTYHGVIRFRVTTTTGA